MIYCLFRLHSQNPKIYVANIWLENKLGKTISLRGRGPFPFPLINRVINLMASEWRRKDPGDTLRFHCRNPHCGRTPKKLRSPKIKRPPPLPIVKKRKWWNDKTVLMTGIPLDDLSGCLRERKTGLCWFLHRGDDAGRRSDNIWLQC